MPFLEMSSAALPQYLWLVVVGAMGSFAFGFGTGSNDVANAFGSSVGAKSLTLGQAVLIAAIFEFAGALVLGRVSTNVIAGGIANPIAFMAQPEAYAYGMVCALATSAFWQMLCSYLELNVSSTHSIIAAIIGFSLVWEGGSAVNWATPDPNLFPPYQGVIPIIISWFASPILTGVASALILLTVRTTILRRKHAVILSIVLLPICVMITTWINMFFVFTKGAKKVLEATGGWTTGKAAWVSACIAAGCGLIVGAVACPILYKKSKEDAGDLPRSASSASLSNSSVSSSSTDSTPCRFPKTANMLARMKEIMLHGISVDIHDCVASDPVVSSIHARAERFDPKAEYVFSWLQVFSAICVVFAHGANEIGYMAGPLTVIYDVYLTGTLSKTVTPEIWIILIGAVGLVFGLATYGYNVTRAMGAKLAKLSASRGFAAELATALVILIASQYGLPTSSSQCITGAIVGVGVLEGVKGVNWKVFGKQFASWVMTMGVVGLLTAGLFAQGVYAPSKTL